TRLRRILVCSTVRLRRVDACRTLWGSVGVLLDRCLGRGRPGLVHVAAVHEEADDGARDHQAADQQRHDRAAAAALAFTFAHAFTLAIFPVGTFLIRHMKYPPVGCHGRCLSTRRRRDGSIPVPLRRLEVRVKNGSQPPLDARSATRNWTAGSGCSIATAMFREAPMTTATTPPAAGVSALADGAAYVDGESCATADARIPLVDLGFIRSDATYDVVHVWKGRFFRLDAHLDRFFASAERLRFTIPVSREELASILDRLVGLTGLADAYVNMTVSRGVLPPGTRDPLACRNRLYAFAIP